MNAAATYMWSALGLALCFSCPVFGQVELPMKYALDGAGLTIYGTTNLNEFQCRYRESEITAPMVFAISEHQGEILLSGPEVHFPVVEFACEKHLMTREFRELLQIDHHPDIVIRIERISNGAGQRVGYTPVSADVVLHIAGSQSRTRIDHARITRKAGQLILSGMHPVAMSHFGIEPPQKLFGTVRTNDLLEIGFEFIFNLQK